MVKRPVAGVSSRMSGIGRSMPSRIAAALMPQLPATTVVTPWYDDGRSAGSQKTCAS